MTGPSFMIGELGVAVPLSSTGVRLIAALQLLLVAGVLAAAATTPIETELRAAATWLTLAASLGAVLATVPALIRGRFSFAVSGVTSIVAALITMTLVGLLGTWWAHAYGWTLLAVSMAAVAYHLIGEARVRGR